jgi:DNA-binding CsgD family transcriptional regulator
MRFDVFEQLGAGIQPTADHARVVRSSRWILGVLYLLNEQLPAARAILEEEHEIADERGDQGALRDLLLTATERRVADLVAEGRTNREVAETLLISVYTVEGNLTRIYRKLGIRSRTELAARMGRPSEPTEVGRVP